MKRTLLLVLTVFLFFIVNSNAQTGPNVTITSSKAVIAEKESVDITATLDAATDKDVTINFDVKGKALHDSDYTTTFLGKGTASTVAGGNGTGSAANQLNFPSDIFVNQTGTIYILDSNNSRIQKWEKGATLATTVVTLPTWVNYFYIDSENTIYISDSMNARIQKWSAISPTWTTVAGGNGAGSNANQLSSPAGFYIDSEGSIFIADSMNNRIQKWLKNGTAGTTVAGGNGQGSAANQLSNPSSVFVDSAKNVYVGDNGNNRVQKWETSSITGISLVSSSNNPTDYTSIRRILGRTNGTIDIMYNWNAGGTKIKRWAPGASAVVDVYQSNYGSTANQVMSPAGFFVDINSNIYLADSGNHRIQKIQIAPQITIKAGETVGKLTINSIDDSSDEDDETIIITPTTAVNAILNSTSPITVTITDINDPPAVTFTFSAPTIVENSPTDVILTASVPVASGKDIDITFTTEGTATESTEYIVSSKAIKIAAGSKTGSLTISTKGLDDTIVEILETINFNIGTLVNATTSTTLVTLLLESDDNPMITSIVASKTTIAEHESTTLTATLDAPASKDAIISLEFTGTAVYDQDFKTNSAVVISTVAGGNGIGSNANQLSYPRNISIDASANIYVSNNNKIQKWAPGANEGTTILTIPTGTYVDFIFVDSNGNVFLLDRMASRIEKWAPGATSGVIVSGGNGSGANANQLSSPSSFFVDTIGNIYVVDGMNNRIQKWAPGTATGVTVAGGNGSGSAANQLNNPRAVFVDKVGNIYVNDTNNNRIQKWVPNSQTGITVLGSVMGAGEYVYLGQNIEGLFVDVTEKIFLMSTEYTNTGQVKHIKKWDPVTKKSEVLAGNNGSGSAANQLNNPQSFTFDTKGNLYIADTENNRIQKHQFAPQIVIKAGQTTAQLIVSGVEDELENEGTELIVLKQTLVQNATLNSQTDITISLLDNTRTLTLQENSPFTGLENGAVAWGDFDRDGDQDVAVMGTGNNGAVTKLYENKNGVFIDTNQNFTKLFGGDISWVDLNKDGWIDLVVSGFNGTPQTKVYINDKGTSFIPSNEYGLPQLYSTKMAWGDLDNDGDIDLVISGIDKDEKYVFNILYKEDNQNKFVIEPKTNTVNYPGTSNFQGFIKGDLKIVDIDLDGDNDIIYNGENSSGMTISNIIYNSYIKTNIPPNYNYGVPTLGLKNSVIEVAKMNASQSGLTILSSGVDSTGANQLYSSTLLMGVNSGPGMAMGLPFPKLKNGDIAVADYNNDGTNDILFTGEDSAGTPTTKMYFQDTNGNYKESPIALEGLRNSTANWVDYDMDGDLDLFLTGTSATGGAKSLLYVSDIANKKNVAPPAVSGLIAEDLGNGKIKFKWNAPKDDFSTNLGYVIKLGTTPGGTELSNTESNLTTGARLITKQAPIYTGFYEMQLNPGKYYWSVQAVDTGLKGGSFSSEDSFTLTYDWKILNQGGIIDRSISGIETPVIKLADLDNDGDLDIIYANSSGQGTQILRFNGKLLIADDNATNPANIGYVSNITSVAVGDIDGDGNADIVRNTFDSKNNLCMQPVNGTLTSWINMGEGLFKSKIKIVDMNNDGQADVVVLGMSTNTISGVPKLWIYEYDKSTNPPIFKKTDASFQIAPLANASFDLGDIYKDQDIDLIISGFSASDGLKCIIYENVTELGGSFTLKETDNNLVAIKDGTTDFIDFDGDGDLDAVFTGSSVNNDIFEIYINKLNENITTWPRFSSGLEPMRNSKISLGDFNGDGYSDLLYSGITGGGLGNVTKLSEFNPSTFKYTDSAFDVSDILNAEVVFGDIDGDNDLDFVIVGKNKNYNPNDPNNINGISMPYIFRTYINVRNDSAKVLATSGKQSATKKIFSPKAATYIINEKPTVPAITGTPVKFLDNVSSKTGTYPIELSWLAATDDHTPSAGLTYAIKIGTTPGAENIMGADANTSGKRKISGKGNVEHNKKWRLSLPVGTYYWSVQAIDASYSGSEFSVPNKFEITAKGLSTESFNKVILVKAYPNPTTDVVTVIIPNEYELERIEMYNSLGQFVGEYTKNKVSLINLSSGNYFLKIFTSGGTTTKKIIKL